MFLPIVAPLLAFAGIMQVLYFGFGVNPWVTIGIGGAAASFSLMGTREWQNSIKDRLRGKKVWVPTWYWNRSNYWSWFIVMKGIVGFGNETPTEQFLAMRGAALDLEGINLTEPQKSELQLIQSKFTATMKQTYYSFEVECEDFTLWDRMIVLSPTLREDLGMEYTRQDVFFGGLIVPALGAACVLVYLGEFVLVPSQERIPICVMQSNSSIIADVQEAVHMWSPTIETVEATKMAYDKYISPQLAVRAVSAEASLDRVSKIDSTRGDYEDRRAAKLVDIRQRLYGDKEPRKLPSLKRSLIIIVGIAASAIVAAYMFGFWRLPF